MRAAHLFVISAIIIGGSVMVSCGSDRDAEKTRVAEVIHASIEWAIPDKRLDLLYSAVIQDSTLFIFHPDSQSTVDGFEAFRQTAEGFFMHPDFRATSSDIRDLRIHLSPSGDAAWYSAILDDRGEWKGQPTAWLNTRWTGVLIKQEGKWRIVQMHFSFASDAQEQSPAQDTTAQK